MRFYDVERDEDHQKKEEADREANAHRHCTQRATRVALVVDEVVEARRETRDDAQKSEDDDDFDPHSSNPLTWIAPSIAVTQNENAAI